MFSKPDVDQMMNSFATAVAILVVVVAALGFSAGFYLGPKIHGSSEPKSVPIYNFSPNMYSATGWMVAIEPGPYDATVFAMLNASDFVIPFDTGLDFLLLDKYDSPGEGYHAGNWSQTYLKLRHHATPGRAVGFTPIHVPVGYVLWVRVQEDENGTWPEWRVRWKFKTYTPEQMLGEVQMTDVKRWKGVE